MFAYNIISELEHKWNFVLCEFGFVSLIIKKDDFTKDVTYCFKSSKATDRRRGIYMVTGNFERVNQAALCVLTKEIAPIEKLRGSFYDASREVQLFYTSSGYTFSCNRSKILEVGWEYHVKIKKYTYTCEDSSSNFYASLIRASYGLLIR